MLRALIKDVDMNGKAESSATPASPSLSNAPKAPKRGAIPPRSHHQKRTCTTLPANPTGSSTHQEPNAAIDLDEASSLPLPPQEGNFPIEIFLSEDRIRKSEKLLKDLCSEFESTTATPLSSRERSQTVTAIFAQLGCLLNPLLEENQNAQEQLEELQEKNKELTLPLTEAKDYSSEAKQLLKHAHSSIEAAEKECTIWKEKNAYAQTQMIHKRNELSRA